MENLIIAHRLDVSADTCPMTFVRTRLQLDRLGVGDVLEVRFRGQEPRDNLPRSLTEQGHEILQMDLGEEGHGRILVRKGEA